MDFTHDEQRHRWVGSIDGQVVTALDYADNGSTISMTRTFTNPPFRGNGYAAELVAHAVDAAEAAGRTVRPSCWYVADWFEAHPERRHLLA
jgi:predicted GNAT family acetyltransferase